MSDIKESLSPLEEKFNSINASATGGGGGTGGKAITYVDNYSALMLMYMYLLNSGKQLHEQRESLLPLLESVINQEKEFRSQVLEAMKSDTSE